MTIPNNPPTKFVQVLASAALNLTGGAGTAVQPVNVDHIDATVDPESGQTIYTVVFVQPIPFDTVRRGIFGNAGPYTFTPLVQGSPGGLCQSFTFTIDSAPAYGGFCVIDTTW